jgi:glycosyltransferase involved in cell wall biosynthesis
VKLFFITNYANEKDFWKVVNESKKKPAGAASQIFEGLLLKGLANQDEVDITACSFRLVPSYPNHREIFWSGYKQKIDQNIALIYLPFINLPVLKQICFCIAIIPEVIKWLSKNRREPTAIIFTCINIPMVFPVLLLRLFFRSPVITVVPDLPSLALTYTKLNGIKQLLKYPYVWLSKIVEHRFDAYVLLTQPMNAVVNRKNRPYIVVEGIADVEECIDDNNSNSSNKGIMYAGALYKQFGIDTLIKGFMRMDNPYVELWLFGAGDMENEIIQYAKNDPRIKFFGMRPREEVIKYELDALLLVNPRPSHEQFTEYSFPSKTLEYMATGTPFLTTRLPGIPDEYFDYTFVLETETEEGIASKLASILQLSSTQLNEVGQRAKKFVLENKNCVVQAKKIIDVTKRIKA